jgi:homoaconitase/3-isopropylmalate dehydratase large subunit
MAQKILSARLRGSSPRPGPGEMAEVAVDQIVLARAPMRALDEAVAAGLKKVSAEVAIAYDGHCVTGGPAPSLASGGRATDDTAGDDARTMSGEMLARGLLVARAGVGYPGPVHLERFASPARLCVTDEPRMAGVGGIGMLTLVVPTPSLASALAHGAVVVRSPVSIQVLLAGRLRPFVCARDVALELLRRGLPSIVQRVEEARGAPVVLEFAGPSTRALSVGERTVLAALAPQVGAAGALFVSDERTEVFLRDQRRSKAHRALAPDAGAPCEEVVNLDLGAVDPLVLDEQAHVRSVRDLAGRSVTQVLLGGDGGTTLRDLLAAATLLKSKRVPSRLDFLVAVPSRQMLEALAGAGALTDLIATGARIVEPDARIASGQLYPPPRAGAALRTCDPEPHLSGRRAALVASAETLAFAVATGEVGDPRAFKRPVRVTVPRVLPTDDVLIARKGERGAATGSASAGKTDPERTAWRAAQTLQLVDSPAFAAQAAQNGHGDVAVVCTSLDEVRDLAERAPEIAHTVRAVLAPYIPSALVALLSGAGVAAIRIDQAIAKRLKGHKSIALPAPSQWAEGTATSVDVGATQLPLTWLALGAERTWATGPSKPPPSAPTRAGGSQASSKKQAATSKPQAVSTNQERQRERAR